MRSVVKLRSLVVAGILGATALGAGTAHAQNLITNGSFEDTAFVGQFRTLPAGNTFLTGWTIGLGGIDHINDSYWLAADGVRSIDLNALSAGSVSQTIATTIGSTYDVSFSMAGNPNGIGNKNKVLELGLTGSGPQQFAFDATGKSRPNNMGWITYNTQFVATSTSTTVTFTSLTSGNSGPALDHIHVSLVRDPGTIAPEPASIALLGLAAVPMGIVLRRRRKI